MISSDVRALHLEVAKHFGDVLMVGEQRRTQTESGRANWECMNEEKKERMDEGKGSG